MIHMKRGFCAALAAWLLVILAAGCSREEAPASSAVGETTNTTAISSDSATTTTTETTQTSERTTSRPTGTKKPPVTNRKTTTTPPATTTTTTTTQAARSIVRVTIPEGYTMVRIFQTLEAKGVASFDDLMQAAKTYDFTENYPLVAAIPDDPYRCFKLEGYLFPDTYDFYKGDKPQDAIGRLLRGSKAKFTAALQQKAKALGYTMDEIIIMASLIEKEGASPSEAPKIAAVLHNRLQAGMQLQLDCTIVYLDYCARDYVDLSAHKWEEYTAHNNTYKCAALPSTPICNPGMTAVNAALNPADSSALFFCANKTTGEYYYADTYEEHQKNCDKAGVSDNGNFQQPG